MALLEKVTRGSREIYCAFAKKGSYLENKNEKSRYINHAFFRHCAARLF